MSSFLKNTFSVGISKIIMIVFGLAGGMIIARCIGPEGNGIIAALNVYPSLFLTFGALGISQSTTHFMGKKAFAEKDIKTAITQIWFFTTIISIVVCFCLMRYLSSSGYNILWVLLAILPIPFILFNTYNTGVFLGKNQIGSYNKINFLPKIFSFAALAVFLILCSFGISGALLGTAVGSIAMFVILLFKNKFIQSFSLKFNWTIIKSLLSLGIVYALSLLIINLNYKVDVILLDKLSIPYFIGIYAKGVGVADYLWEIPMLLSTIVFARSASAKDGFLFSKKVTQLLRLSIVFIGIGSVVLFFLAEYIIVLLYGEAFIRSTEVMRLLLPGVLLLTIYKVLNMDLAGKGKPWVSMKAMIPSVILNIILNIWLIPKYNANGSAVASTVSYTLAAVLFLFFYSREVKIPIREILHFSRQDFKPIIYLLKKYR